MRRNTSSRYSSFFSVQIGIFTLLSKNDFINTTIQLNMVCVKTSSNLKKFIHKTSKRKTYYTSNKEIRRTIVWFLFVRFIRFMIHQMSLQIDNDINRTI